MCDDKQGWHHPISSKFVAVHEAILSALTGILTKPLGGYVDQSLRPRVSVCSKKVVWPTAIGASCVFRLLNSDFVALLPSGGIVPENEELHSK